MIIPVGIFESSAYTFDKAAKTVTITGLGNLTLDQLLYINNQTSNVIIFLPEVVGKGGSITYPDASTTLLTLVFDTSAQANTDKLYIKVDYKPPTNKLIMGGRELKTIQGMPRSITLNYLWEVGEYEVSGHTPISVQGYNPLLPILTESDISELATTLIPLPPAGGIPMLVGSTSALDLAETLSSGTLTLTGATGSLDTLTVNAIAIISGVVPFNTDIDTTYNDIIDNINALVSVPDYTAKKEVTIQLTGISGTADITMGGLTKTATFLTTLAITANTFVSENRHAYHLIGLVLSTTGIGDLIFTQEDNTTFVTGAIVNVTADLAGTQTSLLKILAAVGTGVAPNGFVVAATATTLVPVTTNMAGGIAGGTGIHKVHIEYLLSDGTFTHEDVYLNGLTFVPINVGLNVLRVNVHSMHKSGTLGSAAGDITIRDAALVVYRVIKLGEVQDRSCLITIPKGMVGVTHTFDGGTGIGKEALLRLKANALPRSTGIEALPVGSYHTFASIITKDAIHTKELRMPFPFPELTDIKATGVDLGGGGGIGLTTIELYTE